jgi:hypothetical protein
MGTLHELPHREPLYAETAGRYGDWREPLRSELADAQRLCRAAAARRVDPGVALTLLVERALVLDDLRWLGHDVEDARTVLGLEAAEQPAPLLGPGQPNAGYARALNGLAPAGTRDLRGIPSLPARVLARVDDARVEAILDETPLTLALGEAVAWERAALATGRSMAEWALLVLLAAG